MAVVAIGIVFAGFSRTYYLNDFFAQKPLTPLLHLHGFLFTSWIVLLLTQVTLVAAKRTDIHRNLGIAGTVLAGLMVIVGTTTAITSAKLGHAPLGLPPLVFFAIPFFDMVMFAALVAAGFIYRSQPATHKRLMLLATIVLLPAAIARLPFAFITSGGPLAFYGLADLLLLICVIYDTLAHRRLHPAFLWGGLTLLISHPLRIMISGTGAWMAFAQWMTR
jgi:hypothetical protein